MNPLINALLVLLAAGIVVSVGFSVASALFFWP
jgi:hypothetical protein